MPENWSQAERVVDGRYLYTVSVYIINADKNIKLKYIALNSLRNLKIPCPSKEIMVAVVSILDSIDKKIRLNRQINDNLISLAS